MNPNQEVDRALAHQASRWVTLLRGKPSRGELAEFAEWLKISPRHVREFLTLTMLEKELLGIGGDYELGIEAPTNVSMLGSQPLSRGGSWQKWALAAALLPIIFVGAMYLRLVNDYSTAVGEQRAIELADGSIVHLNTHSRLKVRLTADSRDLELVEGEALFKVRRDPARPFRVHSGKTVIQALGTEFDVYRRPQGTTVAVLEGEVQIAATKLQAGDEAHIASDTQVQKRKTPDRTRVDAWRQRRLVFDQDSLADMIGEFNRYNRKPQFELDGSSLASRHYTGIFDADDPESLVQLLAAEPELVVERKGDVITIRPR